MHQSRWLALYPLFLVALPFSFIYLWKALCICQCWKGVGDTDAMCRGTSVTGGEFNLGYITFSAASMLRNTPHPHIKLRSLWPPQGSVPKTLPHDISLVVNINLRPRFSNWGVWGWVTKSIVRYLNFQRHLAPTTPIGFNFIHPNWKILASGFTAMLHPIFSSLVLLESGCSGERKGLYIV